MASGRKSSSVRRRASTTKPAALDSSIVREHPLHRSRVEGKQDPKQSVATHRKHLGLEKSGRRTPISHVKQSCEETNTVRINKGGYGKLGCTLDRLRITGVEAGSAAESHGVHGFIGRTITHVNGQRVETIDDVRQLASEADVELRFRESHEVSTGKRAVPHLARSGHNTFISQRRRVDPQHNRDEASDLVVSRQDDTIAADPHQSHRRHLNHGWKELPYGTAANVPEPYHGFVSVLGAPGQPPQITKSGQYDKNHGRFRWPPGMSSEQMKGYGLTPGGAKGINVEKVESPTRRRPMSPVNLPGLNEGAAGGGRFGRSHSLPARDSGNFLTHSDKRDPEGSVHRSTSRPQSPSRRKIVHGRRDTFDLSHQTSRAAPFPCGSPTGLFSESKSPRRGAGSPFGRSHSARPTASRIFNAAFLSDNPGSPQGGSGRENGTKSHWYANTPPHSAPLHPAPSPPPPPRRIPSSHSHGDLIGSQWDGDRLNRPLISGIKTAGPDGQVCFQTALPKVCCLLSYLLAFFSVFCKHETQPCAPHPHSPQVVDKYKGPSKKHPVPVPVQSDVFHNTDYQGGKCFDMQDVKKSVGKRCSATTLEFSHLSPARTGRLTVALQPPSQQVPQLSRPRAFSVGGGGGGGNSTPRTPLTPMSHDIPAGPQRVSQRRAHSPMSRATPPWGTHN